MTPDLYNVVMKLVGPVNPLGDSSHDPDRLDNLRELTALVDKLLFHIINVASYAKSEEHSVKIAGIHARNFLHSVKEQLEQ